MTESGNPIKTDFKYWIPFKMFFNDEGMFFKWMYTGRKPFTMPFFEDELVHYRQLPEYVDAPGFTCNGAELIERSKSIDAIAPSALIFHISRCGSTLVSQCLGSHDEYLSLSEVPIFDSILRLRFKGGYDEAYIDELLKAAIKFYAVPRKGSENKLFIKMDSWHLMFYDQLRRLFPTTPVIILYREPAEVLKSHSNRMGIQGVPGLLDQELFFVGPLTDELYLPKNYIELVVRRYFETIADIVSRDSEVLLLNYNEGLLLIMKKIAAFSGIELSPEYEQLIAERGQYHSKSPREKFVEQNIVTDADNLQAKELKKLYLSVEAHRLGTMTK